MNKEIADKLESSKNEIRVGCNNLLLETLINELAKARLELQDMKVEIVRLNRLEKDVSQ